MLVPGQLLGQAGIAIHQGLETGVVLDPGHNGIQLLGSDSLTVVFAIFPALQQEIGALGDELVAALFLISLLADVTADHAINLGDFLEDTGAFLFDGG